MSAIVTSVVDDHTGRVRDSYLDRITGDVTSSVIELILAGLWSRVGNGYLIDRHELLRVLVMIDRQLEGLADES